jgi:hypothetical protein
MVVEISLTNIPKMGNVLVVPLGISHGLRLEPLVDIANKVIEHSSVNIYHDTFGFGYCFVAAMDKELELRLAAESYFGSILKAGTKSPA